MCDCLVDMFSHMCCMKPAILTPRSRKLHDNKIGYFLFLDVEAEVGANGKQTPNLIVCQWDDGEEIVFDGEDCRDAFCRFIFSVPLRLSKPVNLIAHNLGGYDCNFIFQYVVANIQKKPEDVIMKDGRLICCSFLSGGLRLRDSLLFFHGYHQNSNTVLFVNGCCFHAYQSADCSLNSTSPKEIHPFKGVSMERVYEQTLSIQRAVESEGYNVEVIWECEIMYLLKCCDDFKSHVTSKCDPKMLDGSYRLNPRDCFFGGRTGNVDYHVEAQPGEEIAYIDVISLYPSVQVQNAFPKGHPVVITNKKHISYDLDHYFALLKVAILPPRNLVHGILPARLEDRSNDIKLLFPLCRTCAKIGNSLACSHSDDERILHGSWSSVEIYYAVRVGGYRLIKIFEVYHWTERNDEIF